VGNIFNSRGPFHESIIKEQRKASRGEQSKCANATHCKETSTQVHHVSCNYFESLYLILGICKNDNGIEDPPKKP
jgi:hypothetical protein